MCVKTLSCNTVATVAVHCTLSYNHLCAAMLRCRMTVHAYVHRKYGKSFADCALPYAGPVKHNPVQTPRCAGRSTWCESHAKHHIK
jgi:hypothetical protein